MEIFGAVAKDCPNLRYMDAVFCAVGFLQSRPMSPDAKVPVSLPWALDPSIGIVAVGALLVGKPPI